MNSESLRSLWLWGGARCWVRYIPAGRPPRRRPAAQEPSRVRVPARGQPAVQQGSNSPAGPTAVTRNTERPRFKFPSLRVPRPSLSHWQSSPHPSTSLTPTGRKPSTPKPQSSILNPPKLPYNPASRTTVTHCTRAPYEFLRLSALTLFPRAGLVGIGRRDLVAPTNSCARHKFRCGRTSPKRYLFPRSQGRRSAFRRIVGCLDGERISVSITDFFVRTKY